jgi:transmembrane sensor
MTDKEFKRLLEKYQAGHCTPEEEKLIEQWYASFEGEEDGIHPLSAAQKSALEDKMLGQIRKRMQFPSGGKSISWSPFAKMAAAALFLILFGYFAWYQIQQLRHEPDFLTVESSGKIKKVILADGTLIWLKGSSRLQYPGAFAPDASERRVSLSGEALFEVAKNPQQPFLIECGKIQAKVLGTSFNIKQSAEKQQVEVAVLTGKVALSAAAPGQKQNHLVVNPMEQAVAGTDGFSVKKLASVSNYTLGTAYDMRFDETPVRDVLARISQKFDVEIIYKEASDECRLTADFTDQSLANTLQMMASTLGEVRYQINGNQVILEGKACQ